MNFWIVAATGFSVIIGIMLFSLSIPTMMMGQRNDDLWMRELALGGAMVANQLAIVGYLSLVSWLGREPK